MASRRVDIMGIVNFENESDNSSISAITHEELKMNMASKKSGLKRNNVDGGIIIIERYNYIPSRAIIIHKPQPPA